MRINNEEYEFIGYLIKKKYNINNQSTFLEQTFKFWITFVFININAIMCFFFNSNIFIRTSALLS